jgi:hypothetical protein
MKRRQRKEVMEMRNTMYLHLFLSLAPPESLEFDQVVF